MSTPSDSIAKLADKVLYPLNPFTYLSVDENGNMKHVTPGREDRLFDSRIKIKGTKLIPAEGRTWGLTEDNYIIYFYITNEDIMGDKHLSPYVCFSEHIKVGLCQLILDNPDEKIVDYFSDSSNNYLLTENGKLYRAGNQNLNLRASFDFDYCLTLKDDETYELQSGKLYITIKKSSPCREDSLKEYSTSPPYPEDSLKEFSTSPSYPEESCNLLEKYSTPSCQEDPYDSLKEYSTSSSHLEELCDFLKEYMSQ